MTKRAKVKDHKNLERDLRTQAIVSTDKLGYDRYMGQREFHLKQKNELDGLKAQIEELKSLLLNKQLSQ